MARTLVAMRSLPIAPSPEEPEVPLYTGNLDEDVQQVSRDRLAERLTGGLSFTSKMPCPSWGISATRCRVGSILAQKEGTVCHACYAMRGRYGFDTVQRKLEKRYLGLFHDLWTPSLVALIRWHCKDHFRWFDSGDVQDLPMLKNIFTICRHTRDILHWLPTREAEIVHACADEAPDNLVIRLSAPMIDGKPSHWRTTSTVVSDPGQATCPAPLQDGTCGDCRACWDPAVRNVAYGLH